MTPYNNNNILIMIKPVIIMIIIRFGETTDHDYWTDTPNMCMLCTAHASI